MSNEVNQDERRVKRGFAWTGGRSDPTALRLTVSRRMSGKKHLREGRLKGLWGVRLCVR